MNISVIQINEYQNIFEGNKSAYGTFIEDTKKETTDTNEEDTTTEGEKSRGVSFLVKKLLTEIEYANHLNGRKALGVIPINEENECKFCVIDVDDYISDHTLFIESIYTNKVPLLPFRSKSGGLHLYLFFDKPIKAKKAIGYMERFLTILGLPSDTEVFPKQTILKKGKFGSWLNLPYFNAHETKRYLIDKNGEPVIFEEALEVIKNNTMRGDSFEQVFDEIPLNDAPPCLQSIYLKKRTNFRNQYLFSLARYFKAKYGDEFEKKISQANNELLEPITVERLQKTVIASHIKKDYSYNCSQDPLVSLCKRSECKKREYGIGGSHVSQLDFEEFTQYRTDPPYYEWKINGKSLMFYSESDIINQKRFQELCFRELRIYPLRLKDINWKNIVDTALDNIIIKEVQKEDEISSRSVFTDLLVEFFEHRAQARNKEQIQLGRVYKDKERGCYVFKAKNLTNFLLYQKNFKIYNTTEIHARLKKMNADSSRYYIPETKTKIRAWILPFNSLRDYFDNVEKSDVENIKIDMEETYEEEPF